MFVYWFERGKFLSYASNTSHCLSESYFTSSPSRCHVICNDLQTSTLSQKISHPRHDKLFLPDVYCLILKSCRKMMATVRTLMALLVSRPPPSPFCATPTLAVELSFFSFLPSHRCTDPIGHAAQLSSSTATIPLLNLLKPTPS